MDLSELDTYISSFFSRLENILKGIAQHLIVHTSGEVVFFE